MNEGTPPDPRFRPANESARWTVEAMGEVVGRIAREIGTPLTAIEVAVDRLRRRTTSVEGGPEPAELQVILDQSHRLAGLARTLLSLARPLETDPRPIRLDELVDGVARSVATEIRQAGVSLEVKHLRSPLIIHGDPHQIREALTALVANARLALTGWGGERAIHLTTGMLQEGRAFVRVEDSGPGVPEEQEERIFLPFFSEWGRPGIGLALSRMALLGQGGEVYLEPGGERSSSGAAFVLLLSTSEASPERIEASPSSDSPSGGGRA